LAAANDDVHETMASLQEKLAILPDYNFKKPEAKKEEASATGSAMTGAINTEPVGKAGEAKGEGDKLGTTVAGLVGGILTLGLAFAIGAVLRKVSVT